MFEKNEPEISHIVEESLQAVLSGRASIEDEVQRHPQHAAELRRELEAAAWLNARRDELKIRPGYVPASRNRLLAKIRREEKSRGTKRALLGFIPLPLARPAYVLAASLIVFALLFSGVGSAVSYAQATVPGQQFYGLKRASEQVSYALALNDLRRVELRTRFADRRLSEVEVLIAKGRIELAQETVEDYISEVENALLLMEEASKGKLIEKKALASLLKDDLKRKAEKLETILEESPGEMQIFLQDAIGTSVNGAAAAGQTLDELGNPTSQPNGTPILTITPIPPSKTVRPSHTPQPKKDQVDQEDADPGENPKQKISNTPRPTNENRPVKTEKPSSEDLKPPKDEKPTKTDKEED